MKRSYFKIMLVLIGFASLTLTSCKKGDSATDETVSAQDVTNVSNAIHSTSDDATAAAGQVSSYKGLGLGGNWNTAGGNLFVDATITDTPSTGIVITYAGVNPCNGFYRSGTITITNTGGIPWHEAGAVLTVTYTNLKVTNGINTYILNGSHTITNVSGGLAWQVMAGLAPTSLTPNTSVKHQIQSSNMQITFPNGTERSWTVNRTRIWASSNGNTTFTVTVTSSPGSGNVTETGTNRFGESFTNTISSPIIADNTTCEIWRPYTGTWTHVVGSNSLNVVFGTNNTGTQVGTPTYCPSIIGDYGYYITLTRGSGTRNRFVQYW